MAILYVTEYSGLIGYSIPVTPRLATNNIAIGGASAPSNAFSPNTSVVRVHADAICSIAFSPIAGSTPVATAAEGRLAANQTEYYSVKPGDKIAVITNT